MNTSYGNIKAITKRELQGYFASPVAYVFIVIFLLMVGFFTFMAGGFFERGDASLIAFFLWHPWLYLFLVPAVGMRLWSEERRFYGASADKEIVKEPVYDVKVLDKLVTRVAREIRLLEQSLKATNARTTVDAYDQDDAVLGELT